MKISLYTKLSLVQADYKLSNVDVFSHITNKLSSSHERIIILDDDPGGTQTVYGVPVITEWSLSAIQRELESDSSAFYILTNSRGLSCEASSALHQEIGKNIKLASERSSTPVRVISRGDSTLRGHFPCEMEALEQGLNKRLPYILIPFFYEGKRVTVNDIHYIVDDDLLIPVAQTEYAKDPRFSYKHSDLKLWVQERTNGKISSLNVVTISLDILRKGEIHKIKQALKSLKPSSFCIVNAVDYHDIDVFVLALLEVEAEGYSFLPRASASFIRVRLGIPHKTLLDKSSLSVNNSHGGLFIVGSYVPKTTRQIRTLIENTNIAWREISVEKLLDSKKKAREIKRIVSLVSRHILTGKDFLLFTSREVLEADSDIANIEIGKQISNSLVQIMKEISPQPRFLVAKGGVTSSDLVVKALNTKRAIVTGQVIPGVPVWALGRDSKYPGMPYVLFPGNVGGDDALFFLYKQLST